MKSTALEVRGDGQICLIPDAPIDPRDMIPAEEFSPYVSSYAAPYLKQYENELTSTERILVSNQDVAQELLYNHIEENIDRLIRKRPSIKPGIYPIPDLQWEVKEELYMDKFFGSRKVAILKESTPSTEQESQEEKTTVLKDLEEMVKKHGYASALQCASDDIVALRFELEQAEEKINSMSGDGDESQEELWDCLLLELEIIRYLSERTIPTLMNKFTITRKP